MINYDIVYASRQRHADLIAEANQRPVEGITVRFNLIDRAVTALKAAFAKPAQKPVLREGLATH